MIEEAKNIDFCTTGREPTEQDFARISEWIKKDKQKQITRKKASGNAEQKHFTQHGITKSGA